MHNQLTEVAAFYRSRASADLALADKLESDAKAFNGQQDPDPSAPYGIPPQEMPALKLPVSEVNGGSKGSLMRPGFAKEIVPGNVTVSHREPEELVESLKAALGGKAHGRVGPMAKQLAVSRAQLEAVLTPANGFAVLSKGWFKAV